MNIWFLLLILFSLSFVHAQTPTPSYDDCSASLSQPGIWVLNKQGGLNPDGSDGITLLVNKVGQIQLFNMGDATQLYNPWSCPTIYGLFVVVSDKDDNVLITGFPDDTLESVHYDPVTGTGTDTDPWMTTTVVKLKSRGSFSSGNEEITITDRVYLSRGAFRSVSAKDLDPDKIYRFTNYLDSYFLGDDSGYAFKQGTIPWTSMPLRVGVARFENGRVDLMSMEYNGAEVFTSYHSGHRNDGDSRAVGGVDLENWIDPDFKDNGFGFQWKAQDKTSVDIDMGLPNYVSNYIAISSKSLGYSAISSIPTNSVLGLLTMILSLGLIAVFKRN